MAGNMTLVELPSDLLNIVLTYLFEDVSQQKEVIDEDTKCSNKLITCLSNIKKNSKRFLRLRTLLTMLYK